VKIYTKDWSNHPFFCGVTLTISNFQNVNYVEVRSGRRSTYPSQELDAVPDSVYGPDRE
jgi:hypothetical protein